VTSEPPDIAPDTREKEIERLAQELGRLIQGADPEQREDLKELAFTLIREELFHHDEHDVKPILEADARSARIQLILFAVACVLVIAGIAWGGLHLARRYGPTVLGRLTRSTDTQAVIPSSVPVSSQAGSAPGSSGLPASAEIRPPEQVQGLPGAAPAPAGQTSAAAPTLTELDLQIDVLGETRVTVTSDGVRQIDRLLRPPDSRRVKAKDIIELKSSDASAVVLTLNGETLPPLGRPGESRSLTLTQKDLKGNP